jgi:hypothetical protein
MRLFLTSYSPQLFLKREEILEYFEGFILLSFSYQAQLLLSLV